MLLEKHILEKTSKGQYVLVRDPSSITLNDIVGWLGGNFLSSTDRVSEKLLAGHPWYKEYDMLIGDNRAVVERNMSVNLQTLFAGSKTLEPDPKEYEKD